MGEGVLRQEFEQAAKENGVNAQFAGLVEYGKMMKTLSNCDVAVNPIVGTSVSTIINKVADYAAANVPVVNTQNSEEYRQLLEKYNAGINVENGNVEDLATAIKTLYFDEQKRNDMRENAKVMFGERFDRQKSYPKIIDEIEKLLV